MKRRDLERALETVPDFPDPDPSREQYRTPASVAADLLWEAHAEGAIRGKAVLDLGCGTGVFAKGAALLGAGQVTGVDADESALDLARNEVPEADFMHADLADWHPEPIFDTVVMNPPFGAQRKGADRVFYDRAKEAVAGDGRTGGTVWFLAQPRTERFLAAYARDLGASIDRVGQWDYPIEARFTFHDKAVKRFEVAGYRMGFDAPASLE